jgi:hypothetical protein
MSLSGTTTHTSRSMSVSLSPRKSSRASGQSDSMRSLITPRKKGSMSLSGGSSHTSRSMPVSLSPRKSSKTSGQGDPTRSLILSLSGGPSRSMSASISPRKSSRTSGQENPIRSPITPRRTVRGRASSPVKSPRKFLQMDPLGVSESSRLPITPRRSRSRASSPKKSIKSPWEFLQKDPLGVSEPTPAPITPTRLRSGAYSPVKSPRLPRKFLHESIRAVQLHGTPRRSAGNGSTGRMSAKPEESPLSDLHLARLNDRLGVPDSPMMSLSRSSQGARLRSQSQTPRTRFSNHEMFSNREMLVFKLDL